MSRALVLIPGLLCNRELWSGQLTGLTRFTDIVVADVTKGETISEMAASVLSQAPASFALAGFSLGSQVALEIMSMAPDRVERLALLSATHGGLFPAVANSIRHAIEIIQQGGFHRYLDTVYPSYVTGAGAADQALKQCFLNMAETVGQEAGVRQMRALLDIKSPFANLDRIRCPTVIIGGQEDHRTTPAAHATLAQEIPDSELIIIEGAAHFTPLERPDDVTEALQHWITC